MAATDWTTDEAWAGTRRAVTEALGLAPDLYTDESAFEVERRRVFERAWVCVGTANEVAEPGRLLVRRLGSRSVLITRDADGELHAMLNACRHRGTELAEADCDIAGTIRCPYHRWTYATDGRLRSTPLFDQVLRTDTPADLDLVPVRVATWGPLLLACLDPATPALETWIGDLDDRMGGYRLDTWQVCHEQSLDIRANWKLITENFQEYYHLGWVHPELAKVSRVADHYRYQGPGMYCGQTTTPVSGDQRDDWLQLPPAADLDASDAVSGRFVALFPNVILSVLPNHIWLMRLDPIAPGLTRETCTMFTPAPIEQGAHDATREFWLSVNAEDIDIVERAQRGLTHGAVPAGPLSPRFEEPLNRFHRMLADCMTLDTLSEITIPVGDDPRDPAARWGAAENPTPPAIDRAR
jgi:choline monooxygenase